MPTEPFGHLEQKAYQSWWNDGLLDAIAGLGITGIGFSWLIDMTVLGAVFPAVLVTLWQPLREKFIEPRLGYVEFSRERKTNIRKFNLLLLMAGVLMLMLGLVVYFFFESAVSKQDVSWIAALPAILIALPAFAFALHAGSLRFALYGLVLFGLGLVTAILDWHPGWPMLMGGIVVLAIGIHVLLKFVSHHPIDSEAPG
jgi:hypothetical protein